MTTLSDCLRQRSLVSVQRRDIDDFNIQGFVVGLSDTLIGFEYVYDFQIDGLMVLRRSDISDLKRTGTDDFQEKLMKREGIRPGQQAPLPLVLDSWRSLIEQLSASHDYMILERELGPSPEFAIGRPWKTTAAQVEFQSFSGTGNWSPKAERWKYSQLTSLRVGTRYLGFYQRHFERNQKSQ